MTAKNEKLLDNVNEIVSTADARRVRKMLQYFVATVPWSALGHFYEEFKD